MNHKLTRTYLFAFLVLALAGSYLLGAYQKNAGASYLGPATPDPTSDAAFYNQKAVDAMGGVTTAIAQGVADAYATTPAPTSLNTPTVKTDTASADSHINVQLASFVETAHADSCFDTADQAIQKAVSTWVNSNPVPCTVIIGQYTATYSVYERVLSFFVKVTLHMNGPLKTTWLDANCKAQSSTQNVADITKYYQYDQITGQFEGELSYSQFTQDIKGAFLLCSGTSNRGLTIGGDINDCPRCKGKKK